MRLIGLPEDSPEFREAVELMQRQNPSVMEHGKDWFAGLPPEKHRFVPFNGAISRTQLKWMEEAIKFNANGMRMTCKWKS